MQRVLIRRAGGYDRLEITDVPDPPGPGAGEVRIEVDAIGVNYADCVVRMGLYASAKEYVGWPITPGFEVAGRVAAVGPDIDDLPVGEEVMAVTRFGAYATGLVVPRHQVFPRPAGYDTAAAAGFPVVQLTAWFALFELAHPRPGARVLVHSAAGGVGGALVQQAKLAGCEVVGVVGSTHKVETARALGADEVIDKAAGDLWSAARAHAPDGYDVILDANGADSVRRSYRHLARPGRLVVYGAHTMLPRGGGRPSWAKLAWTWLRTPRFNPLTLIGENTSIMGFNLSYLFERREILADGMKDVLAWAAAGKLRPAPVTTYPLARVADAHRDIESGNTVGKLVLVVER